jgi:hypothetical protein
MSSRRVTGLLICAACGRVGFDASGDGGGPGGSGTGSGSGPGSGDPLTGCADPGYGDTFLEIIPCNAFGTAILQNGNFTISNGTLGLSPSPNIDSMLGCMRAAGAFGPAGTFAEISKVLPNGQTELVIASGVATFGMIQQNGLLGYTDSTGATAFKPFDQVAMRWWRLRPINNHVRAEYSANGIDYTTLAESTSAAMATVSIQVAVASNDPAPGTATIEGIDVCP